MGRLVALVAVALVVVVGVVAFRASQGNGVAAGTSTKGAHVKPEIFADMTYPQAREAAKGKLLLVDATATWCPPCQAMERETWPDPELTAWMKERGLAVQVDVDQDAASAKALGIRAMPTMILFRDGQELARTEGGMSAPDLLNWLKQKAG